MVIGFTRVRFVVLRSHDYCTLWILNKHLVKHWSGGRGTCGTGSSAPVLTKNSCSALTLQSVGPAHLPPSRLLAVWPGAQGDPVPDVVLDP